MRTYLGLAIALCAVNLMLLADHHVRVATPTEVSNLRGGEVECYYPDSRECGEEVKLCEAPCEWHPMGAVWVCEESPQITRVVMDDTMKTADSPWSGWWDDEEYVPRHCNRTHPCGCKGDLTPPHLREEGSEDPVCDPAEGDGHESGPRVGYREVTGNQDCPEAGYSP